MTHNEQKRFIINFVMKWVNSHDEAIRWYETTVIPSLNKTPEQAINAGEFEKVKQYLAIVELGGFA